MILVIDNLIISKSWITCEKSNISNKLMLKLQQFTNNIFNNLTIFRKIISKEEFAYARIDRYKGIEFLAEEISIKKF